MPIDKRVVDERLEVVADALVGIVGDVAEHLHAVVIAALEPVAEELHRHPSPPADLQPQVQIKLVDPADDIERGEHAEVHQLVDEGVPVMILQGVVEAVVPLVEQHVDGDEAELGRDHGEEEQAPRPAVLRHEIGNGEPPDGGERREEAVRRHSLVPVSARWLALAKLIGHRARRRGSAPAAGVFPANFRRIAALPGGGPGPSRFRVHRTCSKVAAAARGVSQQNDRAFAAARGRTRWGRVSVSVRSAISIAPAAGRSWSRTTSPMSLT